ncbi:hypothetical protein BV898_19594 [Hypsibius exemplaris]|uniref:Uncharacterized protein n=1 Tax=Hypsibius exemplaris TaxID=2072580 RepID=A0A9X6RPX2_HYPEX|nr:hypothetical protein BV898_19594 [Hypsibius exemplaris]
MPLSPINDNVPRFLQNINSRPSVASPIAPVSAEPVDFITDPAAIARILSRRLKREIVPPLDIQFSDGSIVIARDITFQEYWDIVGMAEFGDLPIELRDTLLTMKQQQQNPIHSHTISEVVTYLFEVFRIMKDRGYLKMTGDARVVLGRNIQPGGASVKLPDIGFAPKYRFLKNCTGSPTSFAGEVAYSQTLKDLQGVMERLIDSPRTDSNIMAGIFIKLPYGEGTGDNQKFWIMYRDRTHEQDFSLSFELDRILDNTYHWPLIEIQRIMLFDSTPQQNWPSSNRRYILDTREIAKCIKEAVEFTNCEYPVSCAVACCGCICASICVTVSVFVTVCDCGWVNDCGCFRNCDCVRDCGCVSDCCWVHDCVWVYDWLGPRLWLCRR